MAEEVADKRDPSRIQKQFIEVDSKSKNFRWGHFLREAAGLEVKCKHCKFIFVHKESTGYLHSLLFFSRVSVQIG
jgi:hypothetical protein